MNVSDVGAYYKSELIYLKDKCLDFLLIMHYNAVIAVHW